MVNVHEAISIMIEFSMFVISLLSFIVILIGIIIDEKK
ncbi:MAG: putative holin-like toxin [Tissierellaceae bacterium]